MAQKKKTTGHICQGRKQDGKIKKGHRLTKWGKVVKSTKSREK